MQKPSSVAGGPPTLALLGIAAGLALVFRFMARQPDLKSHAPEFVALSLLAGLLYLAGVYSVENFPVGWPALIVILGGALVFRLLLLPLPPSLSEDVYRYQWEARVERAGFNPYRVFPAMPTLAPFEDPEHPLATGRTSPTVYPPLTELVFSRIETIAGFKRLFTALDLASLALLLVLLVAQNKPKGRILIYAWNPTVIVAFALSGHNDSLAIALLVAANLLIISHRPVLSIAALALSFLAKFFSGVLLPVFLQRTRWRYAGIFAAVAFLGYLPYLPARLDLFAGLGNYAAGWEGNDSLFRLIRHAQHSKAQAVLVAAVLVLGMMGYALRKRLEPLQASAVLIAGILLLSPNAFPWYFTWFVPFLCFFPSAPLLLMSVLAVLGYAPVVAYAAGLPYRDSPLILSLEYGPVCLWLAYEGLRALRSRQP